MLEKFWVLVPSLKLGLGCIDIVHLGTHLGLTKTTNKQNSGEAAKQRSRHAMMQRSGERKNSRTATS